MPSPRLFFARLLPFFALAMLAQAHIGSPDIYLDGKAGPYPLFVTIRPPVVIPGVAEIEVRTASPGIREMRAVPLPLSGPGAQFAPVADTLTVSQADKQLFTGSLWMMAPGSWQVRLSVDGAQGLGTLAIPVPAAALVTKRLQFGLGAILSFLGVFLIGGVVAMTGASVREARLEPGLIPTPERRRTGRIAMAIAFVIVLVVLWGGNSWWNSEAASYGQDLYKPIHMAASVSSSGLLALNLTDPGWLNEPGWRSMFTRSVDDFVPDHNHLMHLYAIRQPGLDVVYHLHPDLAGSGLFHLALPSMPAGRYNLYADVVHANGFPETLVSTIDVPSIAGRPLAGDDARATAPAWNQLPLTTTVFTLPDGYRMLWPLPSGLLRAKAPVLFRFQLVKPDGTVPADMAFYMGMLGHAAFVKTDGSVFAHIHPAGSVSMAALMLAQSQADAAAMPGMDMSAPSKKASALPNEVSFPYGFPSAGRYRIFVQMKHGTTVETGVFDAAVQ